MMKGLLGDLIIHCCLSESTLEQTQRSCFSSLRFVFPLQQVVEVLDVLELVFEHLRCLFFVEVGRGRVGENVLVVVVAGF
jgi:hypothetical protein